VIGLVDTVDLGGQVIFCAHGDSPSSAKGRTSTDY
jgi:hypothetical protein